MAIDDLRFWLSAEARLLALVGACGLLWSAETLVPLIGRRHRHLREAAPNLALALLLVVTNLVLLWLWSRIAAAAVAHDVGLFATGTWRAWTQAVVGVGTLDFFGYLAHVSLHRSTVGWRIHRLLHCDLEVDVTTAFRQHPGETLWRMLWQLAAVVLLAAPLWVVIVYLSLAGLNAQLEHANIRVPGWVDRLWRVVLVSPDMHKVHHSRDVRETNTNYSNILSVWDRLFGTYTARVDPRELRYGLEGLDDPNAQTLGALLRLPFALRTAGPRATALPAKLARARAPGQ
jgi:sterol desaturase/sphingolipid hydroxylase (fatty acid hydroxylase superfamily)